MEVYSTEEQQIEAIKRWLKENGKSTAITLILVLAGVGGWQYYQKSVQVEKEQVSLAYTQAIEKLNTDMSEAPAVTDFIKANDASEYAVMAAMELAKVYIDHGKLDEAVQQLMWAAKSTQDEMLSALIHSRLARIYAQQKEYVKANEELSLITAKAWQGRVAELKGDFLLRQGDADAARAEYIKAQELGVTGTIQMKIDDLAK